jgi:hypothetical protein
MTVYTFIPITDQYYPTDPTNTAPAVPQSPSGSVTNQASTWEYANSELAVQYYTAALVSAAQKGVAFNFQGGTPAPALNIAQTTPAAPTGSFTQQGTTFLTEAKILADEPYNVSSRNLWNPGS